MIATLTIVMLIPVQREASPSVRMIVLNASKVFLYVLRLFEIDAWRLMSATSKGFPTMAPKAPLTIEIDIFYSFVVFLLFLLTKNWFRES